MYTFNFQVLGRPRCRSVMAACDTADRPPRGVPHPAPPPPDPLLTFPHPPYLDQMPTQVSKVDCSLNIHMVYLNNFYAPKIEDQGAYRFCPVCHIVLLSETLTLLITFEQ